MEKAFEEQTFDPIPEEVDDVKIKVRRKKGHESDLDSISEDLEAIEEAIE